MINTLLLVFYGLLVYWFNASFIGILAFVVSPCHEIWRWLFPSNWYFSFHRKALVI